MKKSDPKPNIDAFNYLISLMPEKPDNTGDFIENRTTPLEELEKEDDNMIIKMQIGNKKIILSIIQIKKCCTIIKKMEFFGWIKN